MKPYELTGEEIQSICNDWFKDKSVNPESWIAYAAQKKLIIWQNEMCVVHHLCNRIYCPECQEILLRDFGII